MPTNMPEYYWLLIVLYLFMNIVSALFYNFIVRFKQFEQNVSIYYFKWFFIYVLIGFFLNAFRGVNEGLFIFLANSVFIVSVFLLRQGILARTAGVTIQPVYKNKWVYGIVIVVIGFVNTICFYYIYDNVFIRNLIVAPTLSFILFSTYFVMKRARKGKKTTHPGDKYINFFVFYMPFVNLILPIWVFLTGDTTFYLIVLLPWQIGTTFLWALNTVVLLLMDTIEIHYQRSIRDGLTGLYNRELFMKKLASLDNEKISSNFGVMFIDIDHFKAINDNYGHFAGDIVIQKVASILTNNVGTLHTCTLARLGGEEFVIACENTNLQQLQTFAETLRVQIQQQVVQYETHSIHITASFGVACAVDAEQAMRTLKRADQAMYQAKANGRNQVYVA